MKDTKKRKRKIKPIVKKRIHQFVIFFNIIWILVLVGYYSTRLVHYYKIENGTSKEKETEIFSKVITNLNNIVTSGNGLYKDDDGYIYKGMVENNYIYYSGLYYRIISVSNDGEIKIITDEVLTSLTFGSLGYDSSNVKNWMLPVKGINNTGIYWNNFNEPLYYIEKTKTCTDNISSVDNITCKKTTDEYVGLLSLNDYNKANGSKSYLNNSKDFYTSSLGSDKDPWVIHNDGTVTKQDKIGSSHGVRPVITLKNSVKLIRGTGTKNEPYIFYEKAKSKLKDADVGEYVSFSNRTYRIIKKEGKATKLILDGTIHDKQKFSNTESLYNPKKYSNIAYKLNRYLKNDYSNSDLLVEGVFYTGEYGESTDYSYLSTYKDSVTTYVGIPQVGDYFITDYDDIFTSTRVEKEDDMIITVLDGTLYSDSYENEKDIRPVIRVTNEASINGAGTKENPYKIGGV